MVVKISPKGLIFFIEKAPRVSWRKGLAFESPIGREAFVIAGFSVLDFPASFSKDWLKVEPVFVEEIIPANGFVVFCH